MKEVYQIVMCYSFNFKKGISLYQNIKMFLCLQFSMSKKQKYDIYNRYVMSALSITSQSYHFDF